MKNLEVKHRVDFLAFTLRTRNYVHIIQHNFQGYVLWRSQLYFHKAFPVNYAVCPRCIRLFSLYECLQSSITAGHRAPTIGTDANALSQICVFFTHKCVSNSNKSWLFFCACSGTFTKEMFLHLQTVCKKNMEFLVSVLPFILPEFLPFHSLDQLLDYVFGHALDCATKFTDRQRQILKQSSRIFTNHNVHHTTSARKIRFSAVERGFLHFVNIYAFL